MNRTEALLRRSLQVGLAGLSYVAPGLAGRMATRLWFTPFPLSRPKPIHIPSDARSIELKSSGSVVRGFELGDGSRTALLIHGWAGSSSQYRRIARRLADEGYRSVVLDLPAHGIEAGSSTNLFEMAEAIELAGSALGKVDLVVAHSLGALATAVAMQHSLQADRLVLLAPGLRPRQALDSFSAMLRLRPVVTKAIEGAMESRFGADIWDRVSNGMLNMRVPAAPS